MINDKYEYENKHELQQSQLSDTEEQKYPLQQSSPSYHKSISRKKSTPLDVYKRYCINLVKLIEINEIDEQDLLSKCKKSGHENHENHENYENSQTVIDRQLQYCNQYLLDCMNLLIQYSQTRDENTQNNLIDQLKLFLSNITNMVKTIKQHPDFKKNVKSEEKINENNDLDNNPDIRQYGIITLLEDKELKVNKLHQLKRALEYFNNSFESNTDQELINRCASIKRLIKECRKYILKTMYSKHSKKKCSNNNSFKAKDNTNNSLESINLLISNIIDNIKGYRLRKESHSNLLTNPLMKGTDAAKKVYRSNSFCSRTINSKRSVASNSSFYAYSINSKQGATSKNNNQNNNNYNHKISNI